MSASGAVKTPSPVALFAFDLAWCLLFTIVVGSPLGGVAWVAGTVGAFVPGWLNAILAPAYALLVLLGMTVVARVIRLFIPKLSPGTYKFPKHRIARAWILHFGLQRVMYLPLWRPIFFSVAFLRTAMLRALGARVPMAINTGSDPQLLDPSLVTIGRGAIIGAGVMTTCHWIIAGRLRLAEVKIGVDAQLHEAVKLGPGTTVGDGAIIGAETQVGPDCTIGARARVGPGCRLLGDIEIGDGAKLEAFVTCERGVRIGRKAIIATGSHLPRGQVVEEGQRFPQEP